MATAAVLPAPSTSATRVEPGSYPITTAILPTSNIADSLDAHSIVKQWLSSFHTALSSPDFSNLSNLFLQEAYWRDQLCLSWDFHTLKNADKIIEFLKKHPQGCRLKELKIDESSELRKPTVSQIDFLGEVKGVSSFLTVETDVGCGRGVVRLCRDPTDGTWKAFTLFTAMHELKGFEEAIGNRRPDGVQHGNNPGRKNWKDRRVVEENFEDGAEPTVLIIGAGQGGLTLAARLKMLGVPTLIVDKNERVGDNWRKRYHQLVLHDPVWYDHLYVTLFQSPHFCFYLF
jgi:hypothetical protein